MEMKMEKKKSIVEKYFRKTYKNCIIQTFESDENFNCVFRLEAVALIKKLCCRAK